MQLEALANNINTSYAMHGLGKYFDSGNKNLLTDFSCYELSCKTRGTISQDKHVVGISVD